MSKFNNLSSVSYDKADILNKDRSNSTIDNYYFQPYKNAISNNNKVDDELGIYKKTLGGPANDSSTFRNGDMGNFITKNKQKEDLVDQSKYFVAPPLHHPQMPAQFYTTQTNLEMGKLVQKRKEDLNMDQTRAHIEHPFANFVPMIPTVTRSIQTHQRAEPPVMQNTRRVEQAKYAR
jgi:hypothetical protein